MAKRKHRRRSYRTKLEIQAQTTGSTAADAWGHSQKTWKTITDGIIRAHVEQLRGDEAVVAQGRWPKATHLVETDYTTKIRQNRRFKETATGAYLNIFAIDDDEHRGRTMFVVCEEIKST
jgi:SPP1 family predicted phage head-tail adaptor